jgi:hypothetical protein
MKKWLRTQPDQPTNLEQLQALIDQFRHEYNNDRPHRSLQHQATPAAAYASRPKAAPSTDRSAETHDRVRTDKVDKSGTSPCASTANSDTSASAEPTPEPTSDSSSTTSTSKSSASAPASSSPSSPST